ncbi:MAG TPA: reverse transcriptase domain-containing protein [Saprospiraceae bacterium]|nr:reverse transcriptase domain-containing protein [Saprospiraceae bacterium]
MKDWLKLRQYTHFSPKFDKGDKSYIRQYVRDSAGITKHRFYPLIHYTISEQTYRRGYDKDGIRDENRTSKSKKREIFYANHLDAQVYAFYGHLLNTRLDAIYNSVAGMSDSVIAYRAIPYNSRRNKCTIDFANEVFTHIRNSREDSLVAVCYDIKGFFDSLDHRLLKYRWLDVLGVRTLRQDHYNVYKSLVNYTHVDISDIIKEFPELKIKKYRYLRKRDVPCFCASVEEFRTRIVDKGLIRTSRAFTSLDESARMGIPQGTPISAVLSNVYMIDFDKHMTSLCEDFGGLYRRYSDDILIVVKPQDIEVIEAQLLEHIKGRLKLSIQESKTQRLRVVRKEDGTHEISRFVNQEWRSGGVLSYLGFDYNGKVIRIRSKSLSNYYRSLKRLIRRKARYAYYDLRRNKRSGNQDKDDWIYRHKIYRLHTHLGVKRKVIDGKVFWGNFISYTRNAAKIIGDDGINDQVRKHWRIVHEHINRLEQRYGLRRTPSRRNQNFEP